MEIKGIIDKNNLLIDYLMRVKRPIVLEEVIFELESKDSLDKTLNFVKDELKRIDAAVCVPLFAEDRLIGIFTLAEKENQEMYSDEDIEFLSTISNQFAVAIERAHLHQELLQADKMSSLGTVAAGMAHEIKNPLASIMGMTEMVTKALETGDSETIEDFKKVVPKELNRINDLVQNLLTYAKPPKLNKNSVNINEILSDVLKLFELELMQKNIKLKKDFGNVSKKELDPEQIKQVFTNLILNAEQSMPNGGELKISSELVNNQIMIKISDTGIGIENDKLKNIFDPFFTTKEKGAGLGLAITYRIVKEHDGEIEVDSNPGQGTTFTLSL
ncbi:MAG: GAF domain-containing protein [Candidatus Saganbacteria bacterium]|nr:GAF domain-containing protein [Candidatus Saganbacteria bacterium]